MPKGKNYQDSLVESLVDRSETIAYLNEALQDGDSRVILLVLHNIAAPYLNITDDAYYEEALALVEALMEEAQDNDDDPLNLVITLLAEAIEQYERGSEALKIFETQASEKPVDQE